MVKSNLKILQTAILLAIISTGGWLLFEGITELFGLKGLIPIMKVIVGLVVVWLVAKFGLDKMIK